MDVRRSHTPVSLVAFLWDWGTCDKRWRVGLGALIVLLPLMTTVIAFSLTARSARASVTANSDDPLQTGWHPDQPGLAPGIVSGGTFGKLFSTAVDGQIYAQPLVSQGTVFVATETNNVYGLDAVTGTRKWQRSLGTPFNPADVDCSDITPAVGVTSTPVIDSSTNIAYLTSKSYVGGIAAWYMHAINVATGAEQPGFPVQLAGRAANDPHHVFNAKTQLQRPGLLLLNGVVYASFGAHCDRTPYEGWIIGISTAGKVTTLWTDEAGQNRASPDGGIWMVGSRLVSDGPGQIIFASGNGIVPPAHTRGTTPPKTLAQSVVRVAVQTNGSLKATDFFSPYDSALLNKTDSDVGSGAPIELPTPYFGTKTYRHIMLMAGKQGYIFVLNANNLGGRSRGPGGSDAIINRVGPNGGLWSKPSVWPGEGGYIYTTTAQGGGGAGKLKAYKYELDGSGKPTLALVGMTTDAFGFSSSSPVITSSGTTSGSGLVWVIWSPDGSGVGAQLRAYDPIPVNGTLKMLYSASIGIASKFNTPDIANNRVYVGTRDGHVLGFGAPVNTALTAPTLDFGHVIVGKQAQATLTLTAHQRLTISHVSINAQAFVLGTPGTALPATLSVGQTLTIPITFRPTAPGLVGANVAVVTSNGTPDFTVMGNGEAATGLISVAPASVSFGETAAGGSPIVVSATFTNVGATPISVTSETLPDTPFKVSNRPAIKSQIAPNASVAVTLTFAPRKIGSFTGTFVLKTTGGVAQVPLSGTAGAPGKLTISPLKVNVGLVPVGSKKVGTFTVSNTGGSPITLTRSKFPVGGVGFTATSALPEGTTLQPGTTLTESVVFAPIRPGKATDNWSLNSDDGHGLENVSFTGIGVAHGAK